MLLKQNDVLDSGLYVKKLHLIVKDRNSFWNLGIVHLDILFGCLNNESQNSWSKKTQTIIMINCIIMIVLYFFKIPIVTKAKSPVPITKKIPFLDVQMVISWWWFNIDVSFLDILRRKKF